MTPTQTVTALSVQSEELADLLFAASEDVFTSMLGCAIQRSPDPPMERTEPFDGVLSLIGLAGPVIGNGALMCTAQSACDMSSRLLLSEFPNIDEQVLDSLGEITNMIVGGFKNLLEARTGPMQISIPSVVYGKNISTRNCHTEIIGGIDCTYEGGAFEVRVRLATARPNQGGYPKKFEIRD